MPAFFGTGREQGYMVESWKNYKKKKKWWKSRRKATWSRLRRNCKRRSGSTKSKASNHLTFSILRYLWNLECVNERESNWPKLHSLLSNVAVHEVSSGGCACLQQTNVFEKMSLLSALCTMCFLSHLKKWRAIISIFSWIVHFFLAVQLKGISRYTVYVSQDGYDESVSAVIKSMDPSVKHYQKERPKGLSSTEHVALHYKYPF